MLSKAKKNSDYLERLDFDASLAEDIVQNVFGRSVLNKARRLKQTPLYQERLNRNFLTADKPADDLAVQMAKDRKVKADYELAIKKGIDAVSDPCDELVAFIESAEDIPEFFDRELIELGGEMFRKKLNMLSFFMYGVPVIAIQAASVGIGAAAVFRQRPKGKAIPLADHDVLGDVSNLMRFIETFKWFNQIAKPGCSERFGSAFAENCRIRIVHGYVRRAINKNPTDWNYDPPVSWDMNKLGVPLSGAEGCVVVTTVVAAIDTARRNNGLKVSDREIEALYQWANYVSFMQGVPKDMLFGAAEETRVDFSAYMLSINASCYRDFTEKFYSGILGVHLEEALFPNSVALQRSIDGVIRASLYNTYGERYCNYYGIPKPSRTLSTLFAGLEKSSHGVNLISRRVPLVNSLLDKNGEYLWEEMFVKAEQYLKELGRASVVSGVNNSHVADAV